MTLIAVTAHQDHAEILTDTLTYTGTTSVLGRATKAFTLPHLDAALAVQGSTTFARICLTELQAELAEDFDVLVRQASSRLGAAYSGLEQALRDQEVAEGVSGRLAPSAAFLVGFSPTADRFRAVCLASDWDFEARDVEGLHVQPSPTTVRPSRLEADRLREYYLRNFDDATPVGLLTAQPLPAAPQSADDWRALARAVRQDRALCHLYSGLKTYVGGDAVLTRIERGKATTQRLLTFDDTGVELETMLAGSLHPVGQQAPCLCESGQRFVDCCLRQIFDVPCPCGAGPTFAACCRVLTAESARTSA